MRKHPQATDIIRMRSFDLKVKYAMGAGNSPDGFYCDRTVAGGDAIALAQIYIAFFQLGFFTF